jgi:dynein heavy chain
MIVEVRDPKLEKLNRKIIVALITTDVHAMDIIEELKKDKVTSDKDFRWVK